MNCIREKSSASERASAFASIVFPTPGKSSMIRWPSATRQRTQSRSVSAGARTTTREVVDDRADDVRGARLRSRLAHLRSPRRRSTSSSTAAAIACLGAFGTRRSPVRVTSTTSFSSVSKPMSDLAHVVVDDEIGVLAVEHRALPLQSLRPVLGAERDEHAAVLALAERSGNVRGRLELDRPGLGALRALVGDALSAGR